MYRIKDWQKHFENYKSKERKNCSFICMPNKMGLGWRRIMSEPDGVNIFGLWCLLLQSCSRQKERDGWLTVDGLPDSEPWTAADLAFLWKCEPEQVSRMLEACASPKVGWIEEIQEQYPLGTRSVPVQYPPTEQERKKERKKEGKEGGYHNQSNETKEPEEPNLDIPPSDRPFIAPHDQWRHEQVQPWAAKLKPVCGTLGAKTWPQFKALVERFGLDMVYTVAFNTMGQWKWADDLAAILSQCKPDKPDTTPVKSELTAAYEILDGEDWREIVDRLQVDGVNSELELYQRMKDNEFLTKKILQVMGECNGH